VLTTLEEGINEIRAGRMIIVDDDLSVAGF
jgi:hypothetical protein